MANNSRGKNFGWWHRLNLAYNANGSRTLRTTQGSLLGPLLSEEHYSYSYRNRLWQYVDGAPGDSDRFDWRYRYSPDGEREQKRLYHGPDGDEYEHVYPWV